jgi:hypothetical protein
MGMKRNVTLMNKRGQTIDVRLSQEGINVLTRDTMRVTRQNVWDSIALMLTERELMQREADATANNVWDRIINNITA